MHLQTLGHMQSQGWLSKWSDTNVGGAWQGKNPEQLQMCIKQKLQLRKLNRTQPLPTVSRHKNPLRRISTHFWGIIQHYYEFIHYNEFIHYGLLRFLFFRVYCTILPRHHVKMAGRLSSSSSIEEAKEYLLDNGIDDEIADNFRRNKVDGSTLVKLTVEDVKELVPLVHVQPAVREILQTIKVD